LLLLVPVYFLECSFISLIYTNYPVKHFYIKQETYLLIICLIIFVSVILPIAKYNPAFEQSRTNSFVGKHKSEVSRKILDHAKDKDRMAVWGWANHFYAETGLAQGTRYTTSQFQIEDGPLQEYYIKRYVADLKANKPSFFVDAVSPSQFAYHNRATQGYENFPHIKAVVDSYYSLLSEIEGVRIFMLRPQGAKVDLPSDLAVYTAPLPTEKQNLRISIDSYKEDEDYITLNGWAFIIDQPATGSKISLLLLSEHQHYILKTYTRFRPDVSAAFGGKLDNCGFLGIIPRQQLAKGSYKLALLVKDASTGTEGFAVLEGRSLEIP
jgi:hypothetical protein